MQTPLPSGDDQPEMSLVIPAYNERRRLPGFLDSVRDYLSDELNGSYEAIVVDDGSGDATANWLSELQECWPQLILLRHTQNQGKGAAVRTGVLAAAGKLLLFADADGTIPILEERPLRNAIGAGADIAVAVRRRWHNDDSCRRTKLRGLAGRIFSNLAWWVAGTPVRDPQCGFKMFRTDVARGLFAACPENGYLFDLHILGAASGLRLRIAEIPVSWHDVAGSKIRLVRDSWRMLRGLFAVRRSVKEMLRRVALPQPERAAESTLPDAGVRSGLAKALTGS
jgi:dolichyl-phosphate beta-glucosyltransferase